VRLFVALRLPPDVVEVVAGLGRPALPGLAWTAPDQWHVTLRFLGEVADDEVASLRAALVDVGERAAPRTARLGPATYRLHRGVLVVPVAGVDDLAAAVVDATSATGRPPERRPFAGHVTVARGRGRRPVPASLAGEAVSAAWEVGSLELVRSELHPAGARYETVQRVALRGGAAGRRGR
jgi:RNA 2',3'-cyclic 3'-phosphodiesterase